MGVHIALFRGINVGGSNVLPMKGLRSLLEQLGLEDVRTYIQSGNVVFRSKRADAAALESEIGAALRAGFGFEPQVLFLEADDMRRMVRANPFPEAESEPKSLHFGFLASVPAKPDLEALEALRIPSERFDLRGRVFHLHTPEGIGRSKLAAQAERLLGVPMTSRNWRTVRAIMALADGLAPG